MVRGINGMRRKFEAMQVLASLGGFLTVADEGSASALQGGICIFNRRLVFQMRHLQDNPQPLQYGQDVGCNTIDHWTAATFDLLLVQCKAVPRAS